MSALLTKHAVRVGYVAIALYILCLVWRVPLQVLADRAVLDFHMLALRAALPGFQGYDVMSVLWGGILAFVYGFIVAVIFHKLHDNCCLPKK